MTWILIVATYINGHMVKVNNINYATQHDCEIAGEQIKAAYTVDDYSIQYQCIKNLEREKE